MNKALCFVLIAAATIATGACRATSPTQSDPPPSTLLPHSMKGYELYSWQAGGSWNYVLMTATDRLKSVEEITTGPDTTTADYAVKVSAQGVDALKVQLGRLPRSESILWMGRQTCEQHGMQAGPLELPPQATIDAVSSYCRDRGLTLHVSP